MTFNQMIYIVTLAKCMSYSEAAKLLYITQPALSRQISLVEDELEVKIFNRNSKNVSLTAAGMRLYTGLEDILNQYNVLIDEVQNIGRTSTGRLRVGIVELNPPLTIVSEAVNELIQSGIHVDVLSKDRWEIQEALICGELDIITIYDDTLISSDIYETITMDTIQNCLVVPANHPGASIENPTLIEFKDCEFLMMDRETKRYEQYFQVSCAKAGFEPKIKYLDSLSELVAMVSVGAGITCFPENHYLRLMKNLKFINVPEVVGTDIKAVWKRDSANPSLKRMVNIFKKMCC